MVLFFVTKLSTFNFLWLNVFRSFPSNYWDKFVKKKVRQKYSETYDFDSISNLLGMETTMTFKQEEEVTGIVG